MKLQTQVVELEPGWLVIKFQGPRPPDDSRPFWLHRTLTDWLAEHPGQSIQRTLPLSHHGELIGVMVWLGEPVPQQEVKFRFHKQLSEMPFEHREALIHKALEVYFHNAYTGPIAVVNRSGIAVVFDPASESGHVLPLAELKGVDEDGKRSYANWQASGEDRPFVFNLVAGFHVE
jgi:hypothetical protein